MTEEIIENAIADLKDLSREISRVPELPVDSPKDALELDDFLSDVMNRVDQIIEDLQRE